MSDHTLPAHIETLLTGLRDNPSLAQGVTAAAGELTGTQRAEAAATYYRSNGYDVTAEELTALEIARKHATGEPLSEHELETVAGGLALGRFDGTSLFDHPDWDWKQFASLASDRRLKESIIEVGRDTRTGLMHFEFAYRADPTRRFRGVMADEVAAFMPEAVITLPTGYHAVDYDALGMQMTEVDRH